MYNECNSLTSWYKPFCQLVHDPHPPIRLSVVCGWPPVMLENRILVAEQSGIWQLKWSRDLQHSTYILIGLDRWLEKPDLVNHLVMSVPSTYI